MVGVDRQQQRTVLALAADAGRLGPAIEQHTETSRVPIGPVFDLLCRRIQPGNVLDAQFLVECAREESATVKQRLPLAYFDQLLGKAEQIPSILIDAFPIEPADLVIL